MELAKLVSDCVGSEIFVMVLFLPLGGSIGLESNYSLQFQSKYRKGRRIKSSKYIFDMPSNDLYVPMLKGK